MSSVRLDNGPMKKLLKLLGVLLAAALVTTGLNGCAVAALTAASAYAASSGDDDTAAYHKITPNVRRLASVPSAKKNGKNATP